VLIATAAPLVLGAKAAASQATQDHSTRTSSGEPDLTGTYLPIVDGDGECIPDRAGVIVVPPLAAGATQISQTPDFVVIRNQGIARVVPLQPSTHVAAKLTPYLGSPQGRWEDDTLVIESTRLPIKTLAAITSQPSDREDVRLIERVSLFEANTLRYEFTVEEPSAYAKPVSVQVWLARVPSSEALQPSRSEACVRRPSVESRPTVN
jgi:hypothetical protein